MKKIILGSKGYAFAEKIGFCKLGEQYDELNKFRGFYLSIVLYISDDRRELKIEISKAYYNHLTQSDGEDLYSKLFIDDDTLMIEDKYFGNFDMEDLPIKG